VTTAPSSVLSSALSSTAAVEQSVVSGSRFTTAATVLTVSSLVSGTACPTLQFMINTYVIKTSAATQYDGGSCTSLKAGTRIFMEGASEAPQTFNATRISFSTDTTTTPTAPTPTPAPTTPTTPGVVAAEVTVTSLVAATSCPALSFMVGGYTIVTSASTHFENGACANLQAGSKIALTGSKSGDTTVVASNIAFRDGSTTTPPTGTSDRPAQPVEGEGVISSLIGGTGCPTLQFLIGSYLIKVDGATQYVGGFCRDLQAGVRVGVKGTVNADRSVTASAISVRSEAPKPDPEAEGEGFVTGLVTGTACPALQFRISEYTITVTASTQFVGGSCESVAIGKKVGVKGRMTGEKAATASVIVVKN
jgi:hypothetical protein